MLVRSPPLGAVLSILNSAGELRATTAGLWSILLGCVNVSVAWPVLEFGPFVPWGSTEFPHTSFFDLPQAVPWPRALGPGWKLLGNCPALTGVLPPSLFLLLRMSAWASCPMGNFSCTADLQEPATFLARTSTCVWWSYHSNYDALKGWRWDFVSGAQSLAHLPLLSWWSLNDLLVKSGIFIYWFWHHGHLPVISICPGRERSRAWYKQIPEIPVFERKTEDQEFKTILNNIKGQPGVHETLSHNIKQTNRRQTKTKFYSK